MICGKEKASESLRVCVDCIRGGRENAILYAKEAHKRIRAEYGLPEEPPKSEGGIKCELCSNECVMKEGERSYCGLKENVNGKLRSLAPKGHALMYAYIDPLPTNCCAAWFCPGSSQFGKVRICWEWNGCGNRNLVKHAAEISFSSGGIVKFDLKAFDSNLSTALSGVPNKRAYENFELIAEEFFEGSHPPVLTATTLLVPFYVDELEVENIARFIAGINPDIPYSLLVFHPDFYMRDMPITPREQVQKCYDAAKSHLKNVKIGNKQLLGLM